jgi:hypothetical protein
MKLNVRSDVHGDHDRNGHAGQAGVLAGALVELLAELHDVDLCLTERGADRREPASPCAAMIWSLTYP